MACNCNHDKNTKDHKCECDSNKKQQNSIVSSCVDDDDEFFGCGYDTCDEDHIGKCTLCGAPVKQRYYDNVLVCESCNAKFSKELKYANDYDGINDLVEGSSKIINGLSKLYGINPNDDNFKDTPRRVARLMMELNYGNNIQAAKDILTVSFPTEAKYDGLVSSNNIRVSSLCPHHMVVADYDVSIAYVPSGGRYVGLSKLPRVARVLAKSMCLQEDYTKRIVDVIEEVLKPAGCAAYVRGIHNCIQARGAEMRDVSNVTIALRGVFAMNPTLKEEWLFTVNDSHKRSS